MISSKSQGWQGFLQLCQGVDSLEQLDELFELLFTLEEREQLALRVELVKELVKGRKTQREIARDLNISIAKITRGSNALKTVSEPLRDYLKRYIHE